jgi:hypothetical protein
MGRQASNVNAVPSRDKRLIRVNSIAQDAVSTYARSTLVLLTEKGEHGRPLGHGSGTLIRSARGCVILTCAHVVEGTPKLSVLHPTGRAIDDAIERIWFHPDRIDVAVAHLRDPSRLASFAITPARIAKADVFPIKKTDPLLVVGFPTQLMIDSPNHATKIMHRHLSDIAYLTTLVGADKNALSIHWDEAQVGEEVAAPHQLAGLAQGTTFSLKKPSGISGGGVWLFDAEYSGLWAPERIATFVAVPHEFKSKRQLALPATLWRDWLVEVIARA